MTQLPARAPFLMLLSLTAGLGGCYIDGTHSRDEHRTVDQIRQEHGWAAQEIGKHVNTEDLNRMRDGDPTAVRRGQRRLARLFDALDRLAWVREAAPRGLWASVDEQQDLDELAFRFTRAGKLRGEAFAESDEIAEALAASPAPGAIKWADLRRALSTLAQAEASEDHVSKELASVVAKDPSLKAASARFATQAPPLPRPFVAAAAAYLHNHGEDRGELDKLPPELSADGKRIRSALDGMPASAPLAPAPPMISSAPAPATESVPPLPAEAAPEDRAAARNNSAPPITNSSGSSGGGLLQVSGDARGMMTSRGLPAAFGKRADGSFTLRYEEPRPCDSGQGTCQVLVDYLFTEQGSLLREEVVGGAQGAAAAPARKGPIENAGDPDQD